MAYPFTEERAGLGTTWMHDVTETINGKRVLGLIALKNDEFPDGIRVAALHGLTEGQQINALKQWFMLNHLPAAAEQHEAVRPILALDTVFGRHVTPQIRNALAAELTSISSLWVAKAEKTKLESTSTPHRAPEKSFPRGLILKRLTADEGAKDYKLAEWAYITPRYPEGLRTGELAIANWSLQRETALYWFILNFEPLLFDTGDLSDAGSYNKRIIYGSVDHWPVAYLLQEEFGRGVISEAVLNRLTDELAALSTNWMRRHPYSTVGATVSTNIVETTLQILMEAVDKVLENRALPGHNHGPPLLDAKMAAQIKEVSITSIAAVEQGEAGRQDAVHTKSVLMTAAAKIGWGVLDGITRSAGSLILTGAIAGGASLLLHLHDAIHVLAAWIDAVGTTGVGG